MSAHYPPPKPGRPAALNRQRELEWLNALPEDPDPATLVQLSRDEAQDWVTTLARMSRKIPGGDWMAKLAAQARARENWTEDRDREWDANCELHHKIDRYLKKVRSLTYEYWKVDSEAKDLISPLAPQMAQARARQRAKSEAEQQAAHAARDSWAITAADAHAMGYTGQHEDWAVPFALTEVQQVTTDLYDALNFERDRLWLMCRSYEHRAREEGSPELAAEFHARVAAMLRDVADQLECPPDDDD